jgi:hypothetical protein
MQFKKIQNLPERLQIKIDAIIGENDEYAADELVEMGEEILSQLAAMGLAVYLGQTEQKDVFNDFIITLFLSKGQHYNAGSLYRWVANMLKKAQGEDANLLRPYFWQKDEHGKEQINSQIHHLANLRNDVMHGFFVLPPDKNREEAQKMENILTELKSAGLFDRSFGEYHFYQNAAFSGCWYILADEEWLLLQNGHEFAKLAQRIYYEYSDDFLHKEKEFSQKEFLSQEVISKNVETFLKRGNGAMLCWYSPNSENGINAYLNLIQSIDLNTHYPIYYVLQDQGATFTWAFLEKLLIKALNELNIEKNIKEDPLKFIKSGKLTRKPVLILHNVHIGLFNQGHITKLFNDCYNASLPILATSWYYPYLNRFVNEEMNLQESNLNSDVEIIDYSLRNYIRFKGLSEEKNQDREAEYVELLEKIVNQLVRELKSGKELYARRFADENEYNVEFVHEAFSILTPFFQLKRAEFFSDEVDELYGFPKSIEESSRIFLSLGRRDLKLEYKHKVLISK